MKIKSNRKEEVFEPIEITITIESKQELAELLCRIQAGSSYFEGSALFGWDLFDRTYNFYEELEKYND